MPVSFRGEEWGTWVDIKKGAAELLRKELTKAKSKGKVTIFMSSSTDPYQPIEYREEITRSLLEVMVEVPPDFLFVQTRSPLVQRDIDLFLRFKDRVRISMTIETDREEIRKHFTPGAPPITGRLKALQLLAEAGYRPKPRSPRFCPAVRSFRPHWRKWSIVSVWTIILWVMAAGANEPETWELIRCMKGWDWKNGTILPLGGSSMTG